MFTKKLFHSIKLLLAKPITNFLKYLYITNQGSSSRLLDTLSSSNNINLYKSQILIVYDSSSVQHSKSSEPFFINGSIENDYFKKLVRNQKTLTKSGIITANDVDLSFPLGTYSWKGKLFKEVFINNFLLTNPKYCLDLETIFLKQKKQLDFPEAILLSVPWYHNFYHWMIDILPRLMLYDLVEDLHYLKLLVPKSSPKFIEESLEITGYKNNTVFIEDGVYRVKTLHFLTRLSNTTDVPPFVIKWLNTKIQTFTQINDLPTKIYISRFNTKTRFVTNEKEIKALLSNYGFTTLTPESLSLEEQIRFFQKAEIVIGPHGAAFTNVAFMKEGTTLIELFQMGNFSRAYYNMANAKQMQYGFLVGKKHGLGFSINTNQLKNILDKFLIK